MNRLKRQLDDIHASKETKEKTFAYVYTKRRKNRIPVIAVLTTAFACLLLIITQPWQMQSQPSIQSYVTLDINPSMEFTLNEKDEIIEIKAYNQEASAILKSLQLDGLPIEEAFIVLWQQENWQGYIKDGILEVGVYSEDASVALRLEKELNGYLSESMTTGTYHCSHVEEAIYEESQSHHMSMGKYRVIQEIRDYTTVYSEAELKNKSMKELYQLLAIYDADAVPQGCEMQAGNGHGHMHGRE